MTAETDQTSPNSIQVFGARTHNLRQVDVEIPIGKITVVTGVSGSGKSSLAFNTIFAEGRHRYLSTISSRSRELLQSVDRPDVDFIDGLPPVLCIEQTSRQARRRSTVATTSEIYDYLRLLFARVGVLHCLSCGKPVTSQSKSAVVEQTLRFGDRQKIMILAPIVHQRQGTHADVFARIVKEGYVRARVDGVVVDAGDPPELDKSKYHDIDVIVDRLILKEGIQSRLEESVDLALQIGQGQTIISRDFDGQWQDRLFSSRFACESCGVSYPAIEPRSMSFNSPAGACSTCQGVGVVTIEDREQPCPDCDGTRLSPVSRRVLIDGLGITDLCAKATRDALPIVQQWMASGPGGDEIDATSDAWKSVSLSVLPEIASRLAFLSNVGLGYLSLDRGCETLSSGEFQRTRLAACLGNQLSGVLYILDEPTAGLHSSETGRLIDCLIQLREQGNTLLLVEHDLEVIERSDWVIDLGPGAGRLGGTVLASGTPKDLAKNPDSITGQFLYQDRPSASRKGGRSVRSKKASAEASLINPLRISGCRHHNLKAVTMDVPLRQLVCILGVSGSGKTSLVMQTLVPAIRRALGERVSMCGEFEELIGVEGITKLVQIDQSPLGRSARSSPASYTGIWDQVRQIFAKTKEARLRGYHAKNFSLNSPESRCPKCAGRGELPVDELRFSDWTVRCPECDGRQFSPAILSVRFKGRSVHDVMELSLDEAATFFENFSQLSRTLRLLCELGLGYLKLGQPASTLSGGEAQRIKLATELAKGSSGAVLYVLDEPTSGLHAADIQQLIAVLKRLVAEGHSVLVVEHNPHFIASADWLIELGPGAGAAGGEIVFSGKAE